MNKIIFIELNEVPLRVFDRYAEEKPRSHVARFMKRSRQFETVTEDKIQLDPWISWPTMHRGVTDEQHQILHLGQILDETDKKYPPIWTILSKAGLKVGVFGSLHSNNLPENVDQFSFYVPDFFAHEVFASPTELLPFQNLNVTMTRESARNVSDRLPLDLIGSTAKSFPALGIKFDTLVEGARQLASEKLNSKRKIRRRNYQSLLMADVMVKQLKETKPDFATIYSNNVAAAMHRYWAATFPEDYDNLTVTPGWIDTYKGEIFAAMDTFDKVLAKVMAFAEQNTEYSVVIGSSMGQGAIPCEHANSFQTIIDLDKFMAAMGLEKDEWIYRPAMVPCLGVVVESEDARERLRKALSKFQIDGQHIQRDDRPLMPMTWDEKDNGFFHFYTQFDDYEGSGLALIGNRQFTLEELGIDTMAHEDGVNCTAQHKPTGSLLIYSPGAQSVANGKSREQVSTLDFVPSVLKHFGLEQPDYLKGESKLVF